MENKHYQLLPLEFDGKGKSQQGFRFEQDVREGDAAVYRKTDTESLRVYWEVIKVLRTEEAERKIGGKDVHFEAKERYPSDKEWGDKGWSYGTRERAMEKFRELL
jgi:hypothetical protein